MRASITKLITWTGFVVSICYIILIAIAILAKGSGPSFPIVFLLSSPFAFLLILCAFVSSIFHRTRTGVRIVMFVVFISGAFITGWFALFLLGQWLREPIKQEYENDRTSRSSRPEGLLQLSDIFSSPGFPGVAWFFGRPLPAA